MFEKDQKYNQMKLENYEKFVRNRIINMDTDYEFIEH